MIVIIDYLNWRGERAKRRITPIQIKYDNSEWHPEFQWILVAFDHDKEAEREFAMRNIYSWNDEE